MPGRHLGGVLGDPGAECCLVAEEGTARWTEGQGGVRRASVPCNSARCPRCGSWEEVWGGSRKKALKKSPGNNACLAWAREMGEIEVHSVKLRKGRLWGD